MQSRSLNAADFKVTSIDLYITSACNRRCSYCFLDDAYFASGKHMTVADVRSIVNWARGGSIEEITILGGEPALNADFSSIVRMIHASGLRVRTVTNGSQRFRTSVVDHDLALAFARVAVSLDAPSQAGFDALRGRGAFRDAMATIQQLAGMGIPFDINYTVVKSTIMWVPQMLSFAESLGAERLNMHWFSPVGRARKYAVGESVPAAEWLRMLSYVRSYQPARNDYVVDCELGFASGMPGEDLSMCAVRSRSNLQFMPDGSVFSCGMLVDSPDQAGYEWHDGHLSLRLSSNEVSCTMGQHRGCPLRAGGAENDYVPLCIYNRLARL